MLVVSCKREQGVKVRVCDIIPGCSCKETDREGDRKRDREHFLSVCLSVPRLIEGADGWSSNERRTSLFVALSGLRVCVYVCLCVFTAQ